MTSLVIKLSAGTLPNPDLDLRYLIPDLLEERSGRIIKSDGYDYGPSDPHNLYLFLKTDSPEESIACITQVMNSDTLLGNQLSKSVVVAIRKGDTFSVVYPASYEGSFKIE